MQLIVESGATKSTWVLLDGNKAPEIQILPGINPTSNPSSVKAIKDYNLPSDINLDTIYFYGAGVSSSVAIDSLSKAVHAHFDCDDVYLEHDMLAASRSVSDGTPSIVSILGTGTNTVIYDGHQPLESFKALGYLFGDYGSGFYIGKLLLRAYFTKSMSEDDRNLFFKEYVEGKDDILFRIYSSEKPNFETAKLTKFLSKSSKELKAHVLNAAFSAFFENQIIPIADHQQYPLNFVGSIAAVFEQELRTSANNYGLDIHKIVANPIDGLLEYHRNNKKKN